MRIFFGILLFFFTLVNFALAQIQMTEIMYDLEGSDSGREWIEIYNSGAEDVDLSGWKLYEGNTNHALVPQASAVISAGGYAIIADNITKFSIDWSSFSGVLFDSSFSLSNTGETFSVRNQDLVDEDTASYTSDMGASGDGNSLQKIDGSWVSALPTVGTSEIVSSPAEEEQNADLQSQGGSVGVWIEDNNKIYADAGENKTVIVGADTLFKGKALGIKKEPLEKARFLWNFGDGTIKEGNSVLHNFRYPGEYIVFLDASSGAYSSSDRILVKATPSNLIISSLQYGNDSYIELHNGSNKELDISFWRLRSGNSHFTIPQNTYILPNKKIIFSERVIGLKVFRGIETALLYPNGEIAYSYVTVPATQNFIENKKMKTIENIPETIIDQEETNTQINIQTQDTVFGAAVSMVDDGRDETSLYKWLTVLSGLIFLSIGGLLFVRSKDISSQSVNADEIEIIE